MSKLRLDKYLADMQMGTRSQVKEAIRKRQVTVNGVIVTAPEYKIDTENDDVTVSGEAVAYQKYVYLMLNKPAGVLSATTDKQEKTVLDLITDKARKDLFPVGRLDKDTEGLLLITNDGELSHNLLSPKKHVDKTYYAKVAGIIGDKEVLLFSQGFKVDEDLTAQPAVLKVLNTFENEAASYSEVLVTIHEGKFHQIKRMFAAVESEVLYLKRLSMGSLCLDENLQPGEYRPLTEEEIKGLYANK